MGIRIDKRGSKATPGPITIISHKHYKSLVSSKNLVDGIKRLKRLLSIQQEEVHARYWEAAARYQENNELRWAVLKAQCLEQARQLFGTHLSHVAYDTVIWGMDGIKGSANVQGGTGDFRGIGSLRRSLAK